MRLGLAATGGLAATAARSALTRRPPGGAPGWRRDNYRGAVVSLLPGPAYVVGGGLAGALGGLLVGGPRLAAAALLSAFGAGVAGGYDDLAGARAAAPAAKGFRGHGAALRGGQLTTGLAKVVVIGLTGLGAGRLIEPAWPGALLVGGLVAGGANVANLLDVRPGRAAKASLLVGLPLVAGDGGQGALLAGPLGAVVALLPGELAEHGMLGDTGANALGALVGLGLAVRVRSARHRAGVLGGLVVLTVASEFVSFSRAIDSVPPLRWLDGLGRAE